MEDETDDLETGYIKTAELVAAMRQGPDRLWYFLTQSLQVAEAESNGYGIHAVLEEMPNAADFAMLNGADEYENADRHKRVAEIAEHYADLEHDRPQMMRYVGVSIYRYLHDVPLTLRYIENAKRQSIENLRNRSSDMIGFGMHDLLETMRLELYIYAHANLDGVQAKRLLGSLSQLVHELQVYDEYLLDALPLLAERKLVSPYEKGLIMREKYNMEYGKFDPKKVARLDMILAEVENMPAEDYSEIDLED